VQTEFKEKTYEKYFSGEIARLTNISFSPDQCDENFLGFDDAFMIPLFHPFSMLPYVRRSRRLRRNGILLSELNLLTDEIVRRMPPFRFNFFVQYKRPEFLRTRGAREWSHWQSAYYRFCVTPHQQSLLERIESMSNGRAATVYASPAFWSANDLWQNVLAEQIIDNSNIASVNRLVGHDCYTYVESGSRGIGHSEPEDIESPRLRELFAVGIERNEPIDAKEHILKAAAIVRSAASEQDQTAKLLKQAEAPYLVEEVRPTPLIEALITFLALSDAFGISASMHG
jgi:hypothetical protein